MSGDLDAVVAEFSLIEARRTDLARSLAMVAHTGQMEKDGVTSYWKHPWRVSQYAEALYGDDPLLQQVCWLHDVLEDTDVPAAIIAELFSVEVYHAVLMLTHKPGQSNESYWSGIKAYGGLVLKAKHADVTDNSNRKRLDLLPEADNVRLTEKYRKAKLALGLPQ